MPPIFPPRSNTVARASLLGIPLVLAVLTGLLVWWLHSSTFNKVGVTIPQPVDFPHSFHISVVGINCLYCHETAGSESFAGMPPTETCMSCHSQVGLQSVKLAPVRESWETGRPIQWNRVNNVPDFVFFDHSIHVNKGVGCESCHGRVDQMGVAVKAETLYMAWCIDCHRDPEKFIRPKDQVLVMGYQPDGNQLQLGEKLVQEYNVRPAGQLMNCSICHR